LPAPPTTRSSIVVVDAEVHPRDLALRASLAELGVRRLHRAGELVVGVLDLDAEAEAELDDRGDALRRSRERRDRRERVSGVADDVGSLRLLTAAGSRSRLTDESIGSDTAARLATNVGDGSDTERAFI